MIPLEPLDLSRVHSIDDLVRAMAKTAFTGRQVGEAADVLALAPRVVLALDGNPQTRRRMEAAGLRPPDIRTLEDLARLPTLTKQEVQDHYDELLSEAVPERERSIHHTSGTMSSLRTRGSPM